jgi:hypothetical protein
LASSIRHALLALAEPSIGKDVLLLVIELHFLFLTLGLSALLLVMVRRRQQRVAPSDSPPSADAAPGATGPDGKPEA